MRRSILIALLSMSALAGYPQGIRDSLFRISQVEIRAEGFFRKEKAGMKETRVDSLVLQKQLNASLSELLSENTPVFIKNHGRGALATASFRGTAPSHTQVTWNGLNITSPMTGMVDFSLIPVYVIDEVSLKHGSASISESGGGLGGTVSIGNTMDHTPGFRLKYMQTAGSYRTFDEFIRVSDGNGSFQWRTRLYHNYSRNDYTFINRGIGMLDPETGVIVHPMDTNHHADYSRYGILQEFSFRPGAEDLFSFKYWGQQANRTIPRATSYEGPDHSNLNNQEDTDHRLMADWKHYREDVVFAVRSGYSDKQLDYTLMNLVPGLGVVPAIHSTSRQKSFQNKVEFRYDPGEAFSLEASVSAGFHDVDSRDTVSAAGYCQQRNEYSGFLSLQHRFAERVNVKMMVRQELVEGAFSPLIPYLGIDILPFSGTDLVVKGNLARNYRNPSLNELYWQPGGNPDLLPETGFSIEAGAEYSRKAGGQKFHGELTFYRSDIDQWIIWIPGYRGYWEPVNIKRVLTKGVELSGNMKGQAGALEYRVAGTYALTQSVNYGDPLVWGDESYGKQLVYVPVHSGNALISVGYRGYYLTWQYNAYSERFTTSSNDISRRDRLYPFFMNDITLGKQIPMMKNRLSLELRVHNLFNETYHSILYRPMPGRNFLMVLMFEL